MSLFISVIIPVYNQSNTLERAIDSVLNQSWNHLELIVVNDGSTEEIKRRKGIRYIDQENKGVSAARNRGVSEASGDWIAFLDADDYWPENRLLKLMKHATDYKVILGKTNGSWTPYFGATLFHRSVFETVGLIDEELTFSEDQDWFMRAKESGTPIFLTEETSLVIEKKCSTFNKHWKELEIHKVLKKSLTRRKGKPLNTLSSYALVSVIIPVHNGAEFLKETLDSVFAQSYPSFEVIAINHGSTDDSCKLLESYGNVQVISQENLGNSHARNTGIKAAKGEFVAFIDQDDIWGKEKLEKQMTALIENPEILYTISHFLSFLSEGSTVPNWCREETFTDPKPDFSPSSLVARKKAFELNGLFQDKLRFASDVDWFFLAKDKNLPMLIIEEVLHKRRVHNSNQSHSGEKLKSEMLKVIRSSVERKRVQVK